MAQERFLAIRLAFSRNTHVTDVDVNRDRTYANAGDGLKNLALL